MKTYDFVWPAKDQEKIANFAGTGVHVYKEMYGSLSDDENNPFSRVSVANVGYSLDAVRGCPLRCSYCVRLSNMRDGFYKNGDDQKSILSRKVFNIVPEKIFDGEDLVKALVSHPTFIKNRSVIAVGTGSTEAFAPVAEKETYAIIHTLRDELNLKNPIWIVTKLGIPFDRIAFWREAFSNWRGKGSIIISITSNGLPGYIESHQADRFAFVEKLGDCGVVYTHHLRPIIRNINDSFESLLAQLRRSLPLVKAVVVGGLRVDPGIVIAWKYFGKLDLSMLPSKPNEKDLPDNVIGDVNKIVKSLGYADSVPVFLHSSQMISYISGWRDYSLQGIAKVYPEERRVEFRLEKRKFIADEKVALEKMRELLSLLKLEKVKENMMIERDGEVLKIVLEDERFKDYRVYKTLVNNYGHFNNMFNLFEVD